jgi:hypothetical protein
VNKNFEIERNNYNIRKQQINEELTPNPLYGSVSLKTLNRMQQQQQPQSQIHPKGNF